VLGCSYWDIFIGSPQVYAGLLVNGDIAVVIVNWGGSAKGAYEVDLSVVGVEKSQSVIVRDLWRHQDVEVATGKLKVESIPAHGNYAYRLKVN